MVYESEFSRKKYLDSCNQSGIFHTSPEYKPSGALSPGGVTGKTTSSPTSAHPPSGSRAERTSRLLASLSNDRIISPLSSISLKKPLNTTSYYDPNMPLYAYPNTGRSPENLMNDKREGENSCHSCCHCHHSCSSGHDRPQTQRHFANNLKTQDGMESYLRGRTPLGGSDDFEESMRPKSTYAVRSIPVRSLDELRETVAIRRNYIKERQQLIDESGGLFNTPYLHRREKERDELVNGPVIEGIVTEPHEEENNRQEIVKYEKIESSVKNEVAICEETE